MTNAMIIMVTTQQLAEEGKLDYTGKVLRGINAAGEEVEIREVEPIHTFAGWKERGYMVKKGEHSDIKFAVWKYIKRKPKDMDEEEAQEKGYCRLKTAAWFKFSQVEPIEQ